jgi:hypothetical protein
LLYVAVLNKLHPSTISVGGVVCVHLCMNVLVCVFKSNISYKCRIFFHTYSTFAIFNQIIHQKACKIEIKK